MFRQPTNKSIRSGDIVTSKHLSPKHSLPQQAIKKCALTKTREQSNKDKNLRSGNWDQSWSKGIYQDDSKGKSQDNCCTVALKGKQSGQEQKDGNPGRTNKWSHIICI